MGTDCTNRNTMGKKIIEVVVFQSKKGVSEAQLLELSDAFGEALKREIKGFVKRTLTKNCSQDKWVELVWWDSMEDAQAALETAPKMAEFEKYCTVLEDDSDIFYLEEKA